MIKRILNFRFRIADLKPLQQQLRLKQGKGQTYANAKLTQQGFKLGARIQQGFKLSARIQQQFFSTKKCLDQQYYLQLINSDCSYKKASPLLQSIINSYISIKQFQTIWKKYSYYVCKVYQINLFQSKLDKLNFLDQITCIHQKFRQQLTSKNLTKVFNKLSEQFIRTQSWKNLQINQKVEIIQIISRYNIKKAKFLFQTYRKQLYKDISKLQYTNCQRLLQAMGKMSFFDTFLLEFCIDQIYIELKLMNSQKIGQIMYYLAKSHRFINKQFVAKAQKRILELLPNFKVQDAYMLVNLTSSFSTVQKAMNTHSYFQQLDNFYQTLFNQINPHIRLLRYHSLASYVSALKRSMHYDQTMIASVISQCFRRKVKQFEQKDVRDTDGISLHNIIVIFHMLASFNYRDTKFIGYIIELIKMVMKNPDKYFVGNQFHKMLWSISVLFNNYEVNQVFPFILYVFNEQRQIQQHESASFYYCYLLLKRQHPALSAQNKKINAFFLNDKQQKQTINIDVSQIQQQIFATMIQCDIPSILQYNLNNVICDIYVPHIVIQVHGFHHFARNQKRIDGATFLKKKIIQNQGYHCFYIAIDQWLIAQDKKQFINNFMELVRQQYEANTSKVKNAQASSMINPKNGRFIKKKSTQRIPQNEEKQLELIEKSNDNNKKIPLKQKLQMINQKSSAKKNLQQ